MDPLTLGLLLSAGSGLYGAYSQNRTNKRNQRSASQRQSKIDTAAGGMMGQGPSDVEQQLLKFLTSGFDPASFTGEGFNVGQDSLMQMLRADPQSTAPMFKAWEPIEQRALDQNLSNFWGSTSGLGQRFGSASARETGRVRGEAAENAASRRQEMNFNVWDADQNRKLGAAQGLQTGGLGLAQLQLAGRGQQIGGFQSLLGAQGQRQGLDAQLLAIMAGLQPGQQAPNALPGAAMDISQLILLLPMLKQLYAGKAA
jgi:hypothetical protein